MYPKLRFKEFSDAWEQRKLKEITSRVQGNDGRVNLQTLTISAGNGWMKQEDRFSANIAGKEQKNYTLLKKGELAYNHGNSKLAKFGAVFELKDFDEALVPRVYHSFRVNNKTNSSFIEYMFATKLPDKELGKLVSSGARMDGLLNIGYEDFVGINITVPSLEEQQKIAYHFRKLDEVITLHQRQCETLKKQKQFFLQNMFPKEGESSPKIRFKGFSDSWKQCKLHEICSMNARIGWQNLRTSEFLDSGDYLLITGTDFVNGKVNFKSCHYVDKYRFDQDLKIQVQNGSILITKDGTLGKVAIIEALPKPATLNAGVFNVVIKSKDIDNYYLYQYLKAPFLMNYVNKRSTGGTIKHLNQSILVDFPVLKPSLQEQQKIGAYFERLDNLITLHQRQYEQLVSLKKYLLTKMFI